MVDYFNRPSKADKLEAIDWEDWKDRIHTPGVVGAIETKYNDFMESEY
jgi:hypothetical protein